MTPEEKVLKMERQVDEIYRALKGDNELSQERGIIKTVGEHGVRIETLENRYKNIFMIMKGAAIGFMIAGLVFGISSWDSVVKFFKAMVK